jgi:hypothetical protein
VDGPGGLETAHSRHRNVHPDDVGLALWRNAQASFAGMAMAQNFQPGDDLSSWQSARRTIA